MVVVAASTSSGSSIGSTRSSNVPIQQQSLQTLDNKDKNNTKLKKKKKKKIRRHEKKITNNGIDHNNMLTKNYNDTIFLNHTDNSTTNTTNKNHTANSESLYNVHPIQSKKDENSFEKTFRPITTTTRIHRRITTQVHHVPDNRSEEGKTATTTTSNTGHEDKEQQRKQYPNVIVRTESSSSAHIITQNKDGKISSLVKTTKLIQHKQHRRVVKSSQQQERKKKNSTTRNGARESNCLRRIKREWRDAVKLGIAYDWLHMETKQLSSKRTNSSSGSNDPTTKYSYVRIGPWGKNLLHWHFSVQGPPNSVYENGIYHGRVLLPKDYPGSPPRVQVLTPSGRFIPGHDICLSASSYHPESWTPRWTILSLVDALRLHMLTTANEIGGMNKSNKERQTLAMSSRSWKLKNALVCHARMVQAGIFPLVIHEQVQDKQQQNEEKPTTGPDKDKQNRHTTVDDKEDSNVKTEEVNHIDVLDKSAALSEKSAQIPDTSTIKIKKKKSFKKKKKKTSSIAITPNGHRRHHHHHGRIQQQHHHVTATTTGVAETTKAAATATAAAPVRNHQPLLRRTSIASVLLRSILQIITNPIRLLAITFLAIFFVLNR